MAQEKSTADQASLTLFTLLSPGFLACTLCLLMVGCNRPMEQALQKDYSILKPCERPKRAQLTSIVSESLCGTIEVYEDRENRKGRIIPLNIMVIPAISPVARPDPIFFLAGGPGQAATEAGPLLFSILSGLREERDIVLVDQRGTGQSNPLDCDADEDEFIQLDLSLEDFYLEQIESIRTCLHDYDADPSLYTTPIAMDDLDEVRRTLGFGKINLFGMSYGTRAALVYIRRHGDTVRSAILDGVAPTTMNISENIAVDAHSALEKVFRDCSSDPTCARAYPNLRDHFSQLMVRLRENPEIIQLIHPRTGEITEGRTDPVLLTRLIRSVLYDRTLSSLLPLGIEEAYLGRYQPLITLGYSFTDEDMGMSVGMMSSVLCAEDMQHTPTANYRELYFDNPVFHLLKEVCPFWPVHEVPASYFEPVNSDLPMLLTSGTLDPVTPPIYAEDAVKNLTNAAHVVVPGVGHGTAIHGCMPDLLQKFIDELEPAHLDASCVYDLDRPPFFTSFAGPVDHIAVDESNQSKSESSEKAPDD